MFEVRKRNVGRSFFKCPKLMFVRKILIIIIFRGYILFELLIIQSKTSSAEDFKFTRLKRNFTWRRLLTPIAGFLTELVQSAELIPLFQHSNA